MANKKICLGIPVIILVFGIFIFSCDPNDEDGEFDINGTWYLQENHGVNKTGSIITINNGTGTLTTIGNSEFDVFKAYSDKGMLTNGTLIIRNIKYKGKWPNTEKIYWECELYIKTTAPGQVDYEPLGWHNTFISLEADKSHYWSDYDHYLFLYTSGNPGGSGWGSHLIK